MARIQRCLSGLSARQVRHGCAGPVCNGGAVEFRIGDKTVSVNVPARAALEREVRQRFAAGRGFALATVNLDHLVKLPSSERFLKAYLQQDLVVADGRPVVWLSKIAGQPVQLMPGSDLVVPLCRLAAEQDIPVAMVGSTREALDDAQAVLRARVPGLRFGLIREPSHGFVPDGAEADGILEELAAAGSCLCFVALGAPKQEVFAGRGRQLAPQAGFASVGAGLDFLGAHQRRAPRWMRALALEWLWRAMLSPRRLLPRYLRCFAILPAQLRNALRLRLGGSGL